MWWTMLPASSRPILSQLLGTSSAHCLVTIDAAAARDIQRYSAFFPACSSSDPQYIMVPGCCLRVQDITDDDDGPTTVQVGRKPQTPNSKVQIPNPKPRTPNP